MFSFYNTYSSTINKSVSSAPKMKANWLAILELPPPPPFTIQRIYPIYLPWNEICYLFLFSGKALVRLKSLVLTFLALIKALLWRSFLVNAYTDCHGKCEGINNGFAPWLVTNAICCPLEVFGRERKKE